MLEVFCFYIQHNSEIKNNLVRFRQQNYLARFWQKINKHSATQVKATTPPKNKQNQEILPILITIQFQSDSEHLCNHRKNSLSLMAGSSVLQWKGRETLLPEELLTLIHLCAVTVLFLCHYQRGSCFSAVRRWPCGMGACETW